MRTPSTSPSNAFIKNFLADSLYYPACDIDGGVIKYCNEHYSQFGINRYVYADYGIKEERLKEYLDGFYGYYLTKSRAISAANLGFDLTKKYRVYFLRLVHTFLYFCRRYGKNICDCQALLTAAGNSRGDYHPV